MFFCHGRYVYDLIHQSSPVLGSHNDKFVSLFRQFSPVFISTVLSKICLTVAEKNISQLHRSLI